ncbi:MAG: hypothetical protein INQ03_10570 [Candidatus Heimdallarchaeota archaeon]|nr:hypothetical protein [Candidatus Heimdallarchaeota archaeon]
MGTIKVVLPDELERNLRAHISQTKGFYKGALSDSIVEAITMWITHPAQPLQSPDLFRQQYPGKYLGIHNNEVLLISDTIEDLFRQVASTDKKVYVIHPAMDQKKVRLGWRSTVAT